MISIANKSNSRIGDEISQIELAKKNPHHFEILYNRYFESIFRFIYQRMDSKETTADITSQVFLKALVNIGKYTSQGFPFSAWLYRIAI